MAKKHEENDDGPDQDENLEAPGTPELITISSSEESDDDDRNGELVSCEPSTSQELWTSEGPYDEEAKNIKKEALEEELSKSEASALKPKDTERKNNAASVSPPPPPLYWMDRHHPLQPSTVSSSDNILKEQDNVEIDPYSHNNSRLSDIVKGTVKPTTRDTKTQTESATKDSSTITVKEAVSSDGAFTPPISPDLLKETASTEPLNVDNCQEHSEWDDFVESTNDSSLCNTSINTITVVSEVATAYSSSSSAPFHTVSTNSVMNGSVTTTETVTSIPVVSESEIVTNVPSEAVVENKQTVVSKLPKAKQLDSLPKNKPCDLPSPKNKTPDASSSKNKFDAFKDRPPKVPKHRTSFSSSKNSESSSKERINDMPANIKTDHNSKNSDAFPAKEKPNQGHNKSRVLDSCSNKSKTLNAEISLLSVNGHIDSESTVSSEKFKSDRAPSPPPLSSPNRTALIPDIASSKKSTQKDESGGKSPHHVRELSPFLLSRNSSSSTSSIKLLGNSQPYVSEEKVSDKHCGDDRSKFYFKKDGDRNGKDTPRASVSPPLKDRYDSDMMPGMKKLYPQTSHKDDKGDHRRQASDSPVRGDCRKLVAAVDKKQDVKELSPRMHESRRDNQYRNCDPHSDKRINQIKKRVLSPEPKKGRDDRNRDYNLNDRNVDFEASSWSGEYGKTSSVGRRTPEPRGRQELFQPSSSQGDRSPDRDLDRKKRKERDLSARSEDSERNRLISPCRSQPPIAEGEYAYGYDSIRNPYLNDRLLPADYEPEVIHSSSLYPPDVYPESRYRREDEESGALIDRYGAQDVLSPHEILPHTDVISLTGRTDDYIPDNPTEERDYEERGSRSKDDRNASGSIPPAPLSPHVTAGQYKKPRLRRASPKWQRGRLDERDSSLGEHRQLGRRQHNQKGRSRSPVTKKCGGNRGARRDCSARDDNRNENRLHNSQKNKKLVVALRRCDEDARQAGAEIWLEQPLILLENIENRIQELGARIWREEKIVFAPFGKHNSYWPGVRICASRIERYNTSNHQVIFWLKYHNYSQVRRDKILDFKHYFHIMFRKIGKNKKEAVLEALEIMAEMSDLSPNIDLLHWALTGFENFTNKHEVLLHFLEPHLQRIMLLGQHSRRH